METTTITNIICREITSCMNDASLGRAKLLLLLLIGLLILFVGLIILFATRKRPAGPAPVPKKTSPVPTEDRQTILRKLADGELTKAEAEEQLNQLGTPVPAAMPVPPPSTGSGAVKGCLIALLIVPLIILIVLLSLFFARREVICTNEYERLQQRIERNERIYEDSKNRSLEQ